MASSYPLNPKQFTAVLALSGPDRFQHFISRVADWQNVWGLRDENGWVSASDDEGNLAFPFWPHPDYAAACATDKWLGNLPDSVEIHEFLEHWLPNMGKDGVAVAVFPTPTMRGTVVLALQLQQAIQDELSRIE